MNFAPVRLSTIAFGAALLAFSVAGCSNDPTLDGASQTAANVEFRQIDRMGKGSITYFSPYASHDMIGRQNPSADYTNLSPSVTSFFTSYGRSSGIATVAASAQSASNNDAVLVPDVLVADLTQDGDASFLGTELNGTLDVSCTTRSGSGLFGGRALTDDAGRGLLDVAFGNAIPAAGLAADDNAELDGRTGTPNVANDNVGCVGKGLTLASFPYLGAPH